jgi:hypothetical protein
MSGGTYLFVIVAPDDRPIYEADFPEARVKQVRRLTPLLALARAERRPE